MEGDQSANGLRNYPAGVSPFSAASAHMVTQNCRIPPIASREEGGAAVTRRSSKANRSMPARLLSIAVLFAVALTRPDCASAQGGFLERLFGGRIGSVEDGTYVAGDRVRFEIERSGKTYLLHYDDDPEIFVLAADRTSLGARVLKYDSGEIAIRVAGWGALTLYTDFQPNGLPAVRVGDAAPLNQTPASLQDVQFVAAQSADRLRQLYHLRIAFVVDWSVLETSAELRSTASSAMHNAARGLERVVQNRQLRKAVGHRIALVTLATGSHPTLRLEGKTLIVTFNPERGYFGSASSHEIARNVVALLASHTASAAH